MTNAHIAADIGGRFTDIAVTHQGALFTCKVPTVPDAPIVHGTTLATNAPIERDSAKTAMLVTDGFCDAVEMAYENQFEQYDIFMDKPPPLVPREFRCDVPERFDAKGNVLIPLDANAVGGLIE
jgi:N-methylhydantoinase A